MRVAQRFAGYSLAEADSLRKAMGKKIREAMAAEEEKFVAGVVANGYEEGLGTQLFKIIEQFADYAFNKSHSYGYGLVAYQTAFLKANYPVEYLAALLTSVKSKLENASVYLNECRLRGIDVQVPDVNRSASDFTPAPTDEEAGPGRIVYGLSAVRNVGEGVVEKVIAERDESGPFASFVDFVERVHVDVLNKRTVESLIKAGAFDSLGHPRKGLQQVHESIIDMTVRKRREHDAGVMSLFGEQSEGPSFDDRPEVPEVEYDRMVKLAHEKEMLGLYISDHPLTGMEARVRRLADCTIGDLAAGAGVSDDAGFWSVGGVVTGLQRRWTRRGELMASFSLEDLQDKIEVLMFPRVMAEHGSKLADDAVVVVRGRLDTREETLRFFANEVHPVTSTEPDPPLRVNLGLEHQTDRLIDELKSLLAAHPGGSPVELLLGERRVARLPDDFAVDTANGLPAELRELLGAEAIAGV